MEALETSRVIKHQEIEWRCGIAVRLGVMASSYVNLPFNHSHTYSTNDIPTPCVILPQKI